jgi:hypothetical protein
MRTELEALERWLAAERAELARFERYATLLGGIIVGAGLTGIILTLIMGCSEPVSPYYWYDRDTTDATDPDTMGSASDTADLPEVPETDFGNTATEAAGTGEEETATPDPTADQEPTTELDPTADPEPTADHEPTVAPEDTGVPHPGTDYPWPTDPVPTDTWPDVPTVETEAPEPTADPDPTADPKPTDDPACADECCHVANGLRWRQPHMVAGTGYYTRVGHIDADGLDICEEMAARADCGIATWRLPERCEYNHEVIVRHPEPDALYPCTIAWTGQNFHQAWAAPMRTGNIWAVRCIGPLEACPEPYWRQIYEQSAWIFCVSDID